MKRNPALDIAKGIGIILVVFGHSYSSGNPFYYWIGSFHMPLFFLVTGIVYGMRKAEYRAIQFPWRKKISTMLVPYLIWGLLTQGTFGMLKIIGGSAPGEVFTSVLQQIFRGNAGFLWFLPTLFLAELLFYLFSTDQIRFPAMLALGCVGLFFPALPWLPGNDSRCLLAFFFIAAGYFGHRILLTPGKPILLLLCTCLSFGLGAANGEVILPGGQLGNPFLFFITSFCGSYIVIQLSHALSHHGKKAASILAWFGKNSIIILCVHNLFTEGIRLLDHKTLGILSVSGFFEGFLVAVPTLVMMFPVITFCNRYLYWSFGKKKPLTPTK